MIKFCEGTLLAKAAGPLVFCLIAEKTASFMRSIHLLRPKNYLLFKEEFIMNTIIINEKDLKKIYDYEGTHHFENFIFNDFRIVIKFSYYKAVYRIHKEKNIYEVEYRTISGEAIKECKCKFEETEEGMRFIDHPNGSLVEAKIGFLIDQDETLTNEEILKETMDLFANHMYFICILEQYIMNKSYERKAIQKESFCIKPNRSNGKKKGSKKKITQFLLNDIVEYISHSGSKHDITCECWVVRGHFRHYKTGYITWISSYEKGKARNTNKKLNDNVYKI
jgi:hypothetical protein